MFPSLDQPSKNSTADHPPKIQAHSRSNSQSNMKTHEINKKVHPKPMTIVPEIHEAIHDRSPPSIINNKTIEKEQKYKHMSDISTDAEEFSDGSGGATLRITVIEEQSGVVVDVEDDDGSAHAIDSEFDGEQNISGIMHLHSMDASTNSFNLHASASSASIVLETDLDYYQQINKETKVGSLRSRGTTSAYKNRNKNYVYEDDEEQDIENDEFSMN